MQSEAEKDRKRLNPFVCALVGMIVLMSACPFNIFSETFAGMTVSTLAGVAMQADSTAESKPFFQREAPHNKPVRPTRRKTSPITNLSDSFPTGRPVKTPSLVVVDSIVLDGDSLRIVPIDSTVVANAPLVNPGDSVGGLKKERKFTFNPDPTRAVWMSALFPGLGQLYNRRYWKLPIVVGAYMGLGYATNWNNTMLRDYTRAYSDIMDNDPNTKSYMDFFAPTVKEEDLDKRWLTDLLRRRKNYYRRNRDLCIICMIGVYAIAMIDAYVDASLSHFDITPDLSVDIAPTLMPSETRRSSPPSIGLYWALNF